MALYCSVVEITTDVAKSIVDLRTTILSTLPGLGCGMDDQRFAAPKHPHPECVLGALTPRIKRPGA